MKNGSKVHFGHQDYEQYRDSVPKIMGGGLWSHRDHQDSKSRKNYRSRNGATRTKSGKYAYVCKV